jgi:hypothetical protein
VVRVEGKDVGRKLRQGASLLGVAPQYPRKRGTRKAEAVQQRKLIPLAGEVEVNQIADGSLFLGVSPRSGDWHPWSAAIF